MKDLITILIDVIFIVIFYIIFRINLKIFNRSYFHPCVLFSLVWTAVTSLHFLFRFTLLPDLFSISVYTYLIFIAGVVAFTLGGVVTQRKILLKVNSLVYSSVQPLSKILNTIFTLLCILGLPFFIKASYTAFISSNIDNFFVGLRHELTYGDTDIGISKYLVSLSFAIFATNISATYISRSRYNNFLSIISFCVAAVYAVFSTGRTFFLLIASIYLGISFILNQRFKIKKVIILGSIFLVGFTIFGLLFGKGGSFDESISNNTESASKNTAVYIVTPLSSFDYELHQNLEINYEGDNTLRFFKILVSSFYGNSVDRKSKNLSLVKDFVFVPYENNVFTFYSPYVHDFGVLYACIMLFLYACLHSGLYYKAKNSLSSKYTIYYSLMLYPLIMSFFQDQYISLLSTWLQFVFFVEVFFFINKVFSKKSNDTMLHIGASFKNL